MAKYGSQIDAMRIPIKGLVPETGTAFPASPAEGMLFHRSDLKEGYQYLNGAWQKIAPTGAPAAHTHLWADITDKPTSFPASTHAHAATDINWGGGGTYGATNVENALDQFASFNDAVGAQLQAHFGGTGDKHAASHVTYAGSTNLAATNVEAALDELDAEKAPTVHQHNASQVIWTGITPSQTVDEALYILATTTLDQQSVAADVNFEGYRITNLGTPVGTTDAVNKQYVDTLAQGLAPKESVRVATTANITLSGTQTIDGVSVVNGDRVLVKNQTNPVENGIWDVQPGAWVRASDSNGAGDWGKGAYVFVEEGSTQQDSGWVLATDGIVVPGTDANNWTQFSGAGQVDAGAGLVKSGNTLNVQGTANRITVAADSIDISTAYVGQTSITTLGTIATGTWNATTISVAKGGTGATDAATARTNLGVLADQAAATASMRTLGTGATQAAAGNHGHALTDAAITGTLAVAKGGTGATTAAAARTNLSAAGAFSVTYASALVAGTWSANINHGLASDFVDVTFIEVSSGENIILDWKRIDSNNIQIRADVAFAASALRVLVTSK